MSAHPADELTRRWAAAAGDGRTVVLSGLALWPMLALLAAAADGPARSELERAAGVEAGRGDAAARDLVEGLTRSEAVGLALGAWFSARVPVHAWWTEAVPAALRGQLSGDPGADQTALDAWTAGHTGGLIRRLPVHLDAATLMVLASALAVRTRWRQPFDDSVLIVPSGPWAGRRLVGLRRVSGDRDQVAVVESTPAGRLTVVTVEGTGDMDVHLVLGEPARTAAEVLPAAVDAVTGSARGRPGSQLREGDEGPGLTVGEAYGFGTQPRLIVETPRFDVAGEHDLLARPELFGLAAATDRSRGHFPRISDQPLAVQQARQDILASFGPEGFEAAAVTAISMRVGASPADRALTVLVVIDRPFAFVAQQRTTRLTLVAGWVADPQDVQTDA